MTPDAPADAPVTPAADEIIARPATYYRMTRYIMVLMFVAMGAWFMYDGFVTYPQANERAPAGTKPPHSDLDIKLQKILGMSLPPLGIALLAWALYNSRGVYRLSGTTLFVPGHPGVPLDTIRRIDKKLWDRKGIAYIDYELTSADKQGRLKLDDFVYERKPTDEIFKRIEQYLLPPEADQAATTAPSETERQSDTGRTGAE